MKKTSLYSLLLLVGLYACKPTEYTGTYSKWNEFFFEKEAIQPVYQNDSLKFAIHLYANNLNDNTCDYISKKEFSFYKKLMSTHNIHIKPENFVFKSSAELSGMTLFSLPGSVAMRDTLIVDSVKRSMINCKKVEDKYTIGVFNNKYIEFLGKSALQCIETQQSGKDYKKAFPGDPFVTTFFSEDNGEYMSAYRDIHGKFHEYSYRGNHRPMWLQAAMTYDSFVADYESVNLLEKEFFNIGAPSPITCEYNDADAIVHLKSRIADQQIVIINEVHWQANHRYLGDLLLEHLYSAGFRYLAMECIDENEDSLNLRKYPVQESGFYSKDPVAGNLIRNALRMGFKIVSYDEFGKDRNYKQAQNIYDKILAKEPDAKVFVWSGGGHLNKSPHNKLMGYHLDSLSGGKVFAISQRPVVYRKLASADYLGVNNPGEESESYDLIAYNNFQAKDMKVIPSAPEFTYTLNLSDLSKKKITQHKKLLVMVYNKNEFDSYGFEAVPVKNTIIRKKSAVPLSLPQGKYYILIKSPYETVLQKEEISL